MPRTSTSSNTTEPGGPPGVAVAAAREPGMRPVHPGEILEEILEEGLRVSITEAAARLRITRQTLHRILSGQSGVTAEMALRLGKLCGNGPDLWLALQAQHDLAAARPRLAAELEQIPGPEQGT